MGLADTVTKAYMKDNSVFADRLRTKQAPRDSNPGLTDILILSKITMSNYILVEGR